MNFSDEEYVRLYVADTVTWKCLKWEGQTLLALTLRKFDRSGVLDFGHHGPEKALMVATELPMEVIQAGLPRLLDEGVWVLEEGRIFWPKYDEAQTCKRSERVRQRSSRARRQAPQDSPKRDEPSQGVTECHELTKSVTVTPCDQMSRGVTSGHEIDQNVTVGHESVPRVTNVTKCHPRRGEAGQGILDSDARADLSDEDKPISCPPNLRLTDEQIQSLVCSIGIQQWQIDVMTAEFAVKNCSARGNPRSLLNWQQTLSVAIVRAWNGGNRPKKPEPEQQLGTNGKPVVTAQSLGLPGF